MRTRAPVVVIGGGVAGCSTLYHLTKLGWSDIVLGLDHFVIFEKGDFLGRDGLLEQKAAGVGDRPTLMVVGADCIGDEPVDDGDEIVGRVSSGGYGHHAGQALAMGYIDATRAVPGMELEIAVLGERRRARTVPSPLYDPADENLRS